MKPFPLSDIANTPAFVIYAMTCLALCLNLTFLWVYSGIARTHTRTALNPEDARFFKASLAESTPPLVARVLRAHENAQANIHPFLFLGLVFVLAGGTATTACWTFGIFVAARVLHSVAYLAQWQPWRTIGFTVGGLATAALMIDIVILLVNGHAAT